MTSFFEKLKKGMSIKEPLEDIEETEEEVKKPLVKKPPLLTEASAEVKKKKLSSTKNKIKGKKAKKFDIKTISVEIKKGSLKTLSPFAIKTPLYAAPAPPALAKVPEDKPASREKWFEQEGELAIDIYQTENDLVIQSAIAGINPEDLDITMEKDIMTIKGFRKKPLDEEGDYFTKECFWGAFKREIILPAEVDPGLIQATMKEGVLIIRLPKILREKKRIIKIKS